MNTLLKIKSRELSWKMENIFNKPNQTMNPLILILLILADGRKAKGYAEKNL